MRLLALLMVAMWAAPHVIAQYYYPKVLSAAMSGTGAFAPGDTISITYSLADASQPAAYISFGFKTADGKYQRDVVSESPGGGVATATVDASWPNATYHLDSIMIGDAAHEYATYGPDGTLETNSWFTPAAGVAPDLTAMGFTVTGATATVAAPTLTSLSLTSAATLSPGDPITFAYTLAPGSGSKLGIHIFLRAPDGSPLTLNGSADASAPSGTISLSTGPYSQNGTYQVTTVYVSNEDASRSYSSSTSSMLAGLNFTFAGGSASTTYPSFSGVTLDTSGPLGLGDTVTATCDLVPGGAPITYVALSFSRGYGGHGIGMSSSDGGLTFTVKADTLDGTYALNSVTLTDAAGHSSHYTPSGSGFREAEGNGPLVPMSSSPSFKVAGVLAIPPVIAQQPVGGTVEPGATRTLQYTLKNGPDQTAIQWYIGQPGDTSQPVAHAENPFTPPPPSSTTTYWARVSNEYGAVDTDAATLTVHYTSNLPVIYTQPATMNGNAGQGGFLQVYAAGPGPLTYQWYKDGNAIAGATNPLLQFDPLTLADTGTYAVRVTNPNGWTESNTADVYVTGMPQIITQPTSLTIPYGSPASFTVGAIGGQLSYTWHFVGQANNTSFYAPNSPTLNLGTPEPQAAGTYTVDVSNFNGHVTSVPVTLTLTGVPVPVFQPVSTIYSSVNSWIGTQVFATFGPVHYTATGLPPGITIDDYGAIRGQLTASGTYHVTVSAVNAGGTGSTTFDIVVAPGTFAPVITQQPVSQTAVLNTSVTFTVNAAGTPLNWDHQLHYQWYFNHTPISTQDAIYNTLTIDVNSSAVAGDYYVVVTGEGGTATSDVAHLTVDTGNSAPRATTLLTDHTIDAGSTLVLSASFTGSEPMTYTWTKGLDVIAGATSPTYTITNASEDDAAEYAVVAKNAYGTTSGWSSHVLVHYAVQPASLTILPGQTATLSVPSSNRVTYQWYRGRSGDMSSPISGATGATYVTPALTAAASYWVEIDNGRAFSDAANITVSSETQNYAGTYFGTFTGGGVWAMEIGSDNHGKFLGFWPQSGAWSNGDVAVAADGTFAVTPGVATGTSMATATSGGISIHTAADAAPSITGQIDHGAVNGAAAGLVGSVDVPPATPNAWTGEYAAVGVANTSGQANIIVGPSGKTFALVVASGTSYAGSGTCDASGAATLTDAAGDTIAFQGSASGKGATVSVTPGGAGQVLSYSGLAAGAANSSRLLNLSARAEVSGNQDIAVVGFVVTGTPYRRLLLRGAGPSLKPFGVSDYVTHPSLALFDSMSHTLWSGTWSGDRATIATTATNVGAFPFVADGTDCAYLGGFTGGAYTLQMSGIAGDSGIGITEIYDTDSAVSGSRLVNISARAKTGPGDAVLTAGFVIGGDGPETILLRGIGPGLIPLGVTDALAAPKLVLFDHDRDIASNAGWGGDPTLEAAFKQVAAFDLSPTSKDAAMLVTLAPGSYTAQVQTQDGSSGVVLVEVYEIR